MTRPSSLLPVTKAGLAVTALAMLLAGCGVVAGTGRGVSTAGNAVSDTSTAAQQTIHNTTGAAKQ